MKRASILSTVFILGALVLWGCAPAPVLNVNDESIVVGDKYSQEDVQKAITRAGAQLGWQMKDVAPGHMVGTLRIRTHLAEVDIKYDKTKYSINYKDSVNLGYDGANIHKNYNVWISDLNKAIHSQLENM